MKIVFISSFVPRKCGIATYTRDIAEELVTQGNSVSVIALKNEVTPLEKHRFVQSMIEQNKKEDYTLNAKRLNNDGSEIIHLQHEFGLFGGIDGEYIVEFARTLTKPLIVTFHTILLTPSEHQKYIIQELARLSRSIIVMDEVAKNRLEHIYGLNARDSEFILHGAPIVTMKKKKAKEVIKFPHSFVLLANNLLSRNKGIEYAIEAVSESIKEIPNLIFLVVGETHPLVIKFEDESYRKELIALVKKRKLEKHVLFINKYVSLEELQVFLAAADVYITPYLDPQQITSGTLSYAIGAGKACIATEYIYARDMLAEERGTLVPFRDSAAITKALIKLRNNPKKLQELEKKVTELRKDMRWSRVAKKHVSLYKKILKRRNSRKLAKDFINEPVDISYLSHLTDGVGILQHTAGRVLDVRFGYSSDDNGRALIVLSELYKREQKKEYLNLIKTYIEFVFLAQEKNGTFHTFLNFQKKWTDKASITDVFGRVLWGLGYHLYSCPSSIYLSTVELMFHNSIKHIHTVRDTRNAAYTMLALYYYILARKTKTDAGIDAPNHIKRLADFLLSMYEKNHRDQWEWFEDTMTYDNFRLPQALFAAYMITGVEKYKIVAKKTLEFITTCNYDVDRKYFDFIGQNGWYTKGQKKAEYDQQPLEAAAAVDAYLFASLALHKISYRKQAHAAFEWFFGNNRNHRSIYDETTKGVFDGLTVRGVNQNEGAESIICFLMSCLSLQVPLQNAHN